MSPHLWLPRMFVQFLNYFRPHSPVGSEHPALRFPVLPVVITMGPSLYPGPHPVSRKGPAFFSQNERCSVIGGGKGQLHHLPYTNHRMPCTL